MSETKVLDILKSAILLEKRGFSFYSRVATQAQGEAVKKFFEHMAHEEVQHVELLSKQFRSYQKVGHFEKINLADNESVVDEVLTEDLKKEIEASSFEAAAISSAIDFEKRAVELYGKRALETTDIEEKNLYTWLSKWEQTHLDDLVKLDDELQETVWFDNNFWPM